MTLSLVRSADSELNLAAQRLGYHPQTVISFAHQAGWTRDRLHAELARADLIDRLWSDVITAEADRVAATVGATGIRELTDEQARTLIAPALRAAAAKHDGGSVVLLGPTGTGKTLTALLMARAFARNHVRARLGAHPDVEMTFRWRPVSSGVAWAEAVVLAQAVARHPLGQGPAPELEAAKGAPLLILDDVALADRDQAFLEVLGHRYDAGLPTIFTLGLSRRELVARYGDAVVRRMLVVRGRKAMLVEVGAP